MHSGACRNKSKGSTLPGRDPRIQRMQDTKIEWADKVWNIQTGCLRKCLYCYADKMAKRLKGRYGYSKEDPFKPTFHEDRINEPFNLYEPSRIFVSSMGDLFGEWVDDEIIQRVIGVAMFNPRHTFIFLTKNPGRYEQFDFPQNCWLGYSSTGDINFQFSLTQMHKNTTFVSIEPLIENPRNLQNLVDLDWIIIGAETGNRKDKIKTDPEWVFKIMRAKTERQTVFIKDSILKDFAISKEDLIHYRGIPYLFKIGEKDD